MAIIRSKIARQLLAEGGVSLNDAKMMAPPGEFLAYINPKEADMLKAAGGSGIMTPMGIPSFVDFGPGGPSNASSSGFGTGPGPGPDPDTSDGVMDDTYDVNVGLQGDMPAFTPPDPDGDGGGTFKIPSIITSGFKSIGSGLKNIDSFIGRVTNRDAINRARRRDYLIKEGIIRSGPLGDQDLETQGFIGDLASKEGLDFARSKGYTTITDMINKDNTGGDNQPIKKLRAPITEKIEKEKPKDEFEEIRKFYSAKFEDGGEVRQKYGLGSLVKKATGALKKIVKSPIGKAAILGFGAYKLGQGSGLLKSFKALDPIKQALILGGGALTAAPFFMGQEEEEEKLPTQDQSDPAFQSYLAYYGGPTRFAANGGDIDEAPMKMASYGYDDAMSDTYQMFLQMKEKDLIPPEMKFDEFLQEVVPEMSKKQGIERAEADGGGMMNPNDEMLDLGGNEMDLRGGGFVPLGEYEKKDDVPARLSKNEFVFTADAVRAAGGGSVDRGADLMYKTMKQLENKVV